MCGNNCAVFRATRGPVLVKGLVSEWIDISRLEMALGQVVIMPCANEKRDNTSEGNFCGFVLHCSVRRRETAQLFSHTKTLMRVHRQEEEGGTNTRMETWL